MVKTLGYSIVVLPLFCQSWVRIPPSPIVFWVMFLVIAQRKMKFEENGKQFPNRIDMLYVVRIEKKRVKKFDLGK